MKNHRLWLCGIVAALSACGGGGGGTSSTPATPSPTTASATTLSAYQAKGNIPNTYQAMTTLAVAPLQTAFASLPSASGFNYLKITFADPVTGEQMLLSLGRYQDSTPLKVQVPAGVKQIQFEIYNAAGSVSGYWSVP